MTSTTSRIPALRTGRPPAGFLVRIASAVGIDLEVSPEPSTAVEETGSPRALDETTWESLFEHEARAGGLRSRLLDERGERLAGLLGRRSALVQFDPQEGWRAICRDRRDRFRLITPHSPEQRLSAESMVELLEASERECPIWLLVEPTLDRSRSRGEKLSPGRRLLSLVKPDRADIVTVFIYAAFLGLMTLATPIAVQQLVNSVAFGGLVQPVVVLAFLLFLGLCFAGLLTVLQAVAVELIQRRIFVRACVDLAERLPRLAPDAFGDRYGPEVVNRFFDLVQIQKTGATLLAGGTALILQTVTGLTILSFYHPLMLGFSVMLILAIVIVVGVLGRGAVRTAVAESSAKYELGGWMEEIVRRPESFRDAAGRSHAARRADSLTASWLQARRRHFRVVVRQVAAAVGLQVLASTAVLGLGGILVVQGQLTMGQLVASELIVAAVVAAFARLGKLLESAYDLLAATDKVGVLLDLPVEESELRPLTPHAASERSAGETAQ